MEKGLKAPPLPWCDVHPPHGGGYMPPGSHTTDKAAWLITTTDRTTIQTELNRDGVAQSRPTHLKRQASHLLRAPRAHMPICLHTALRTPRPNLIALHPRPRLLPPGPQRFGRGASRPAPHPVHPYAGPREEGPAAREGGSSERGGVGNRTIGIPPPAQIGRTQPRTRWDGRGGPASGHRPQATAATATAMDLPNLSPGHAAGPAPRATEC